MSDIVTTHQLSKRYGDRQVVHDVDLRIPEGVVYGFLGPNGAGKSTTMKMLLSLIRPSSGSIRILGEPMTRENRHRLLEHSTPAPVPHRLAHRVPSGVRPPHRCGEHAHRAAPPRTE